MNLKYRLCTNRAVTCWWMVLMLRLELSQLHTVNILAILVILNGIVLEVDKHCDDGDTYPAIDL